MTLQLFNKRRYYLLARLSTWMMLYKHCSRVMTNILARLSTDIALLDVCIVGPCSRHSIYIYALCYAIFGVGIYTPFVCFIGVLGLYLDGISRLISPGNREPRHCSLLS